MSDYLIFLDNKEMRRASYEDIDSDEYVYNRDVLLSMQNSKKAKLYCGCCEKEPIGMTLTTHKPTPHIITSKRADYERHFKYCRHYIGNGNKEPEIYKTGLIFDDKTGISYCNAFISPVLTPAADNKVYMPHIHFYANNHEVFYYERLPFSEFIRYLNYSYFETFQRRKDKSLTQFLDSFWAKVIHTNIGASAYDAKPLCDILKANGLSYFQKIVTKTVPYVKKDGTESSRQFYVVTKSGKQRLINTASFDKADKKFKYRYSNISVRTFLDKPSLEYEVMLCGIVNENDVYDPNTTYALFLVNKYGLISESSQSAMAYNAICDLIINDSFKRERYLVRKPYFPEKIYKNHDEYLADMVIEHKTERKKIIFECFSNETKQNGYKERQNNKINSCMYRHVFYAPFSLCKDTIDGMVEELRKML